MRKLLFLFIVCIFQFGISQNKRNQETDIVSHQVKMGETIRMISKKYLVDPAEIYRLNKFAVEGIKEGMTLQIPVPRKEAVQQEEPVAENYSQNTPESVSQIEEQPVTEIPIKEKPAEVAIVKETPVVKNTPIVTETSVEKETHIDISNTSSSNEHTVVSGETLYSLSRQYSVSVDAIKAANGEILKKGLKVGQIVTIPSANANGNLAAASSTETIISKPEKAAEKQAATPVAEQSISGNPITHTVEPKETLYSLSKRYGVTVDDIKAQNPDVNIHGLQIGQKLTITKN